jgi:predicted dehydrogenase
MRWGVLGATAAISRRVMPAITTADRAVLAAVAGRPQNAVRVAEVAAAHGTTARADYAALLADPEIDAVYIALPNSQHVGWTLRALRAGKHVLVEKPMALTAEDVRAVAAEAAEAGRTVMEAFMYRHHPQQQRAAELLAAGEIGELRVVRAAYAFRMGDDPADIRLAPALGGGATWDVGCYAVDTALRYFGREPERVRATLSRRPGAGVDTSGTAVLDFGGGRSAVLDYAMDYGPRSWLELQGTHGSLTVADAWAGPCDDGVLTVRTGEGVREERIAATDHYRLQVEAFGAAARGRAPAPVTTEDSLRAVRVLQAVFASAAADGAPAAPGDAPAT